MAVRKISGTWWVDFQFRRRRYRLRIPGKDRSGALEYERTLIARLQRGESVYLSQDPRALSEKVRTFGEFAKEWLSTYVEANLKPSTRSNYFKVVSKTLLPFFGKVGMDGITDLLIERFKVQRKHGGVTNKTVNNDLSILRRMLSCAVAWKVIPSAPRVPFLKAEPARFDYLTLPESRRLLEHTYQPRWRLFFFVALRSGLRAGELIGLRWEDIDLERGLLVVRRSIVRGIIAPPKSNRIRYIPLASDLHAVLRHFAKPTGYVFAQWHDEPVTQPMAYDALKRACRKAGLRRIGLHVLRHSFASHLVMAGAELYPVQSLLGHADPKMTQRYAHLAPAYLRSVIDALPRENPDLAETLGKGASINGEQMVNSLSKASDSIPEIYANHSEKRPVLPVSLHGRADRN